MKIKLYWFDGTDSFMYGDTYTEKDIDSILENMKRKPDKRLYRYGTRWDLVKSVEVLP